MVSVDMFDGQNIKRRVLDVNVLYEVIDRQASEFFGRYKCKPKYIKIPEWVYHVLRQGAFGFFARPVGNGFGCKELDRLFGYIVCETVSIEEIEDIEVF